MPINWSRRKYSEDDFIYAWNSSFSIAEVARKLELNIYGSTYTTIKDTAKELNLSSAHMTGQGHLKGKTHGWTPKRDNKDVFAVGKKENNGTLKNRLVKDFGWELCCQECGNKEWMGQPISIELEHINGDNHDNRIENLKFLCPNCHALTPTWHGRNIKGRLDKLGKSASSKVASKEGNLDAGSSPAPPTCNNCKKEIKGRGKTGFCLECVRKQQEKIDWPETKVLLEKLKTSNYSKLSRELGVSDNAIRKRIKYH